MANESEKETARERQSAGQGLGLSCNDVGVGRGRTTRSGRLSVKPACKCCLTTVPCNSKTNKKPEESSGAAKKTATTGGVSESEPKKSVTTSLSYRVWKERAPVNVKHTAASLVQKEARVGAQETSQVTRPPRSVRPDPPVKKTSANSASPQQVWRQKPQPESTDTKELPARKLQSQPSGGTLKSSTKKTNPSPPNSKSKKLHFPKEVKRTEPSAKDQFSKGKQVQKKQAKHKASIRRPHLEPRSFEHHKIKWTGIDESDNVIGVCCALCEKDLGIPPYDGDGSNDNTIPVTAVLPCGHSFHNDCLNLGDLDGKQGEPPCIFCESYISP